MASPPDDVKSVNLDKPRYDQNIFSGRAKHFFISTNPLNLFSTPSQLQSAKNLVDNHRAGKSHGATVEELWDSKYLVESAYHPDTGEKMTMVGRMSAQVPMNTLITGCMMTFRKSFKEVLFWQWFNQTFMATVNYTNRSGSRPISKTTLGVSYVAATLGAVGTAMGLNNMTRRLPSIFGRFVPFVAVAVANSINIPCMRNLELVEGIPVFDENGTNLGDSTAAAKKAIPQVIISRIGMATPGMIFPPILMASMEKRYKILARSKAMNAAALMLMVGVCLVFATPVCCAFFPQKSSLRVDQLEPSLRQKIEATPNPPTLVFFNKGL